MILMACKTSGDSSRRVPGIIFREIQDSFTTQGLASKAPSATDSSVTGGPGPGNPDLLKLKPARLANLYRHTTISPLVVRRNHVF
jgi:hypothetical protein